MVSHRCCPPPWADCPRNGDCGDKVKIYRRAGICCQTVKGFNVGGDAAIMFNTDQLVECNVQVPQHQVDHNITKHNRGNIKFSEKLRCSTINS